jgi:hypothetical protein
VRSAAPAAARATAARSRNGVVRQLCHLLGGVCAQRGGPASPQTGRRLGNQQAMKGAVVPQDVHVLHVLCLLAEQ